MLFKVTNKDNKGNSLFIQGSYSRNTSNDVSSITFQNYDDDSKQTHNIARIAARDAFGSSNMNGYGDLLFMTTGVQGGSLQEKMRIKSTGQVCIGSSEPINSNDILSINGDVSISSNITAHNITISSNATVSNNLYVINNTTIDGEVTASSNLYVYQNADVSGTATIGNNMTVRGRLSILPKQSEVSGMQFVQAFQTFESIEQTPNDSNQYINIDGTSNLILSSNLTVLGDVLLLSNMSVNGHTIFNSFDVSNDIVVHGNATVHSALIVNSNAIIGKDAILVGNVMTMSNVTLGASPSSNVISINGRTYLSASHPSTSALTINQVGYGPLMSIQRNGVNKVQVTNEGYVGINTSNPTRHLEVVGDMNIIGDIYQNGTLIQNPPTPLSFSPVKTSQKTYKTVVSWINNAKKLETLYVSSYMTNKRGDDQSSSNFSYSLRVYDTTNNIQLHTSIHSNQSPSNLLLPLSNVLSNSMINMELQSKVGPMGNYACVQSILLNYA
jgi:cytoskeletal protein CcmA (bactofilin family)